VLFIGAFSNADDYGNIEAHPHYLKRKILGYHDEVSYEEISEWREAIITLRSVTLYTVSGKEYLHFNNWEKYQKLDSRYARKAACPLHPGGIQDDTSNNGGHEDQPPPPEDSAAVDDTPEESAGSFIDTEQSGVKAPRSLDIERDAEQSKVKQSKEKQSKNNKAHSRAPPPPPALTTGQKYFLEAFGRKRFATNIQKQVLADCEREVGTERLKEAIDWAARNGISRVDSILTAARKGGRRDKKGTQSGRGQEHNVADREEFERAQREVAARTPAQGTG